MIGLQGVTGKTAKLRPGIPALPVMRRAGGLLPGMRRARAIRGTAPSALTLIRCTARSATAPNRLGTRKPIPGFLLPDRGFRLTQMRLSSACLAGHRLSAAGARGGGSPGGCPWRAAGSSCLSSRLPW